MQTLFATLIFLFLSFQLLASGDHKEQQGKEHDVDHVLEKGEKNSDEHGEHGEEHGEEQELPSGITYFNDEKGEFSLKAQVIKNFGIETSNVSSSGNTFQVPETAIVRSLMKTSVFLFKDDKFRDVEVKVITHGSGIATVQLQSIFQNFKIVTKGVNFLKTIQLSLEEGPSEGHGH
ncbi:MAG: hypothetical protein K2P81_13775 [Bacteriovoracaceae bacterium]|nr:hypothetical protein [Bacteriovoracaceae bacterium]